MIGAFVVALDARPLASLDVTRDRGLFRENAAGQIENIYTLKVINKTQQLAALSPATRRRAGVPPAGRHSEPGARRDPRLPGVGGLYRRTRQEPARNRWRSACAASTARAWRSAAPAPSFRRRAGRPR
ncbi:FixG Ig-like domain-containing protein [Pseudomonas aeruginosa]